MIGATVLIGVCIKRGPILLIACESGTREYGGVTPVENGKGMRLICGGSVRGNSGEGACIRLRLASGDIAVAGESLLL